MKIKRALPLFLAVLLLLSFHKAFGQISIRETPDLNLIYFGKLQEYIVPHMARCFENTLAFENRLFQNASKEKVTIFLSDFSDYGNAGATAVPRKYISMDLAPTNYVYETTPSNERMNWTINHEMVHVLMADQAAGSDRFYRSFFLGKVRETDDQPLSLFYSYLTNPRRLSPRWYHEGLAVFLETWLAGGLGRALGAYDEMVFRSMVQDRSRFYDLVGLESEGTTIDFQVGVNSYLYGARFVSYLAQEFGAEKLLSWARRTDGSRRYFADQFHQIFGRSISAEWNRWIEWEQGWQQANLDSIRKNPVTPYRPLVDRALGSVSRGFYHSQKRKLYMAVLYPGQVAHIAAMDVDSGALHKLCEVKGPTLYTVTSLAYDPEGECLYYTSDNARWRDLNRLDIKTGKSKRLMTDVRTGDLAFNRADKSLWGVRHFNGFSTLVRIPYPYTEWNQIYTFPYGSDIFDIDISPDGNLVTAALVEISGRQKLIQMEIPQLLQRQTSYTVLFDFENSLPQGFVFSPDGKYLYGSSYYSGVSNIYRYDLQKKDMDILSNCDSGLFQPVPFTSDSLIVMRYSGKGFVPVTMPIRTAEQVSAIKFLGNQIVEKNPVVKSWLLGSPKRVNIDSLTTHAGSYGPLHYLRLDSAYPIVEGYKNFPCLGYRFNFSDLAGLSAINVSALYTPDVNLPVQERMHLGLAFRYYQWQFHAAYNGADFYDLFGPTKTSRKGYAVQVDYDKSLIYDKPRTLDARFSVSHYGGLERLPDYQNVAATYSRLVSARAKLDYQYIRKSLGSVDDEKGIRWQALTTAVYVNDKIYPRLYSHLDYGMPLALDHSSIWIRSSAGYSFGDRNNPFVNFFFGGFGNNWVDHLQEKRYRESYSFPGVDLNHVGGKNYGKLMLEWNLPPIRFRHLGFTSIYLRWLRTALFASALTTNFDAKQGSAPLPRFGVRRTLFNLGTQLDFRIVTLSRFDSFISVGYAAAWEKNKMSKEFMVSLKIL
jgi:hypothetical protein